MTAPDLEAFKRKAAEICEQQPVVQESGIPTMGYHYAKAIRALTLADFPKQREDGHSAPTSGHADRSDALAEFSRATREACANKHPAVPYTLTMSPATWLALCDAIDSLSSGGKDAGHSTSLPSGALPTETPETDVVFAGITPDCRDERIDAALRLCRSLERRLRETEKALERAIDSEMDKLLAMPDERIQASLRMEGRDPKDVATIGKQIGEIAILKHDLSRALAARASSPEWKPTAESLRIAKEWLADPDERAQVKIQLCVIGLPLVADMVDEGALLSREIIRLSAAPAVEPQDATRSSEQNAEK